jgi:probable phosphoglycerate mutase
LSETEPTRLIVLRHAETAWNADLRLQGQMDIPLNDNGRQQAKLLARSLAHENADALYSSDLLRARETAEAVAETVGLPLRLDSSLRERCFGIFEGETFETVTQRWPEAAERWRRRDTDFAPDGGEVLSAFSERAIDAASRIAAAHPAQTVIVVTHGGVLDCLYRAATRLALDAPRAWQIGNASINRLLHTASGLMLVGWDDRMHLDTPALDDPALDMRTGSANGQAGIFSRQ